MKIVDAHAHFTFDQFGKDLANTIQVMKKKGVWKIVNNGVNLEDNKKVLALSKKYDLFLPAMGFYPTHIIESMKPKIDETFKFIRSNKDKIVAVGEVGLDLYHDSDPEHFEKQLKYFKQIVQLANEIGKPLIVHSRKAEKEIYEPLKNAKIPVVMHCFSGPAQLLQIGIDRDYYFTVPCSVIRNKNQKKVAQRVPLNRLLTETDAPYLAPEPKTRNNSSNIKITLKRIAELRGIAEKEISNIILENFKRLFIH